MTERPVAFVTGASRGIGRAICLELARGGFDIAGNATAYEPGKKEKGLAEVKARCEELGASFLPAAGDISNLDLHEQLLKTALDQFQRVDVLVNNAGVAPAKRMDILETTPENYDAVQSVNARGTFFLTQRFSRHMKDQARGKSGIQPAVIFISSVSAYASSPSRAEYCMSKAAISHAAKIFAHRLAECGINVYEVRPGIIHTDMTAPVQGQYDQRIKDGLIPQMRWGFPEDVARAVAALARGDFNYSTGMVFEISGGLNILRL